MNERHKYRKRTISEFVVTVVVMFIAMLAYAEIRLRFSPVPAKAPTVNVAVPKAAVTVNVPKQPAPVVNVPAPIVRVLAPRFNFSVTFVCDQNEEPIPPPPPKPVPACGKVK